MLASSLASLAPKLAGLHTVNKVKSSVIDHFELSLKG